MKITLQNFDQERALYGIENATVYRCTFDGPADGESALKECKNIAVEDCNFALRYPLWHVDNFTITNCTFTPTCRAALWYDVGGKISHCNFDGIKALRECSIVKFDNCKVDSAEFGWKCNDISFIDCQINAEYFLFMSKNVSLTNVQMTGKYSFQYVKNLTISNCNLDTKDAFWHAENVIVTNSVVKGEYLGWYSKGLTLVNCKIIGTQPLCYCENLKLVNCTMIDTDLAFEYSNVDAQIVGNVLSIKNPKSGSIVADSISQVIFDGSVKATNCKVVTKG